MLKCSKQLSRNVQVILRNPTFFVRYSAVLLALLLVGCVSETSPDLTVKDGVFMQGGHPVKGIGINYFSAFLRILGTEGASPNLNDTSYRQGFKTLREHEIPFIRFCAAGFFPSDWTLYQTDKVAYFKALDQLVADAEACGLGLIPSLFWYFPTVPDLVGEPVDQWGNPESKTHEFMRRYTTEVVSRYKDSPAIWAWEFGNEWIHEADLPNPGQGRGWTIPEFGMPAERTERDKMYRKNIYVAYRAFAETVRSLDPVHPVFSGDTMPRPVAFHTWKDGVWKEDSKEEWQSMFLKDNQVMDALSAHFYYYEKSGHRDSGIAAFDPEEQLSFMMATARQVGKPLFVGEFGPSSKEKTIDEERRQFEVLLDLLVKHEVPLSALWNFDYEHVDQVHWNITEDNHRAYMLDALQQANRSLKGE